MSQEQLTAVAQKFNEVDTSCVFDDSVLVLDPVLVDHVSIEFKSDARTLRDDETSIFDSVGLY